MSWQSCCRVAELPSSHVDTEEEDEWDPFGQRWSGPRGLSGHLSSYLLSYCSAPPPAISAFSPASFASALHKTHQRCCHSDSRQMFDATLAKSKADGAEGGGRKCTCKWMRSCTTLGVSISSVICKAPEENSTSRKKHAYRSISCASLRAGGCAVAAGVTGSPSPQLTNKYNQLSWDPSCCCHSHYSWTNTYIKQSEGHWLLADTRTHYIATHVAATYLTHARRYVHTRFHALSTLIAAASTHISYQRNRPFHPPRHVDQNNHIISKLRSATHI